MSSDNALSVLLSALPSGVVSSIEAQYTFLKTNADGTTSTSIELRSSASFAESTSTSIITSVVPNSSSTAGPTSTPSTFSIITSAPSSQSHVASSTSSHPALQTSSSPASSQPHQLKNASIAGIATGVAAAVVFILLFALFLFRRKRQGRFPFKPSPGVDESERTYPEIAWLYDAKRTGSQSRRTKGNAEKIRIVSGSGHDRDGSGDGLLAPREGTVEVGSTASNSREYFTPPATPPSRWNGRARYDALPPTSNSNAEDPLLAPVYFTGGHASPSRSPARSPPPRSPARSPGPTSEPVFTRGAVSSHAPVSPISGGSPAAIPVKNPNRRKRSSVGSPVEARTPLTAIHEESHYGFARSPEIPPNPLRSNPNRHST